MSLLDASWAGGCSIIAYIMGRIPFFCVRAFLSSLKALLHREAMYRNDRYFHISLVCLVCCVFYHVSYGACDAVGTNMLQTACPPLPAPPPPPPPPPPLSPPPFEVGCLRR